MTKTLLLIGSLLLPAAFWLAPALLAGTDDPPEKLEWRWSKEKASLEYCVKKQLADYDVELVHPKERTTPIEIRSKSDRKLVHTIKAGHHSTVLTRAKDTLFIAEYSPIASGCDVTAVDLKSGKRIWTTSLQGIGPTRHSEYYNSVNIDTDGSRIIVNGNESRGRYVEILDIKTGKTLANKKLKPDGSI